VTMSDERDRTPWFIVVAFVVYAVDELLFGGARTPWWGYVLMVMLELNSQRRR
jgi:hypothetical protein